MQTSTRLMTSVLLCTFAAPVTLYAAPKLADEQSVDENWEDEVELSDDEGSIDDDDLNRSIEDDPEDGIDDTGDAEEVDRDGVASEAGVSRTDAAQRSSHFVEATGAFGVQLGTSPYLPEGDGTQFHHPMTNGFALGVTGGMEVLEDLFVIANFEHTSASSRDGEVNNALDKVDGLIDYQTVVVGLRSVRKLGPGHLFGELAAGVVLPFNTQVQYEYAPALAGLPTPIEGSGSKTDEYNLGFGAHGALGYQTALSQRAYMTLAVKLKGFATSNDGKKTRFENFVADFAAPAPVTVEMEYATDGVRPSTYSVQDLRMQLAVGMRF